MPSLPVFLLTGLGEAKDWEQDESAHIVQYLQTFGCANGINRVERLGRRKLDHRGGGRFILAEYTEAGAQRLREAASRLEKKGVGVRMSNRGFRAARPKPQAPRASLTGPQAPSAGASAAPLTAPGEVKALSPPARPARQAKLVCRPFQTSECSDIRKCEHAHVRVCRDYANKGHCRFADARGNGCRFHHIKWDEDVGDMDWHGAARWNRQSRSNRDRERDMAGRAVPSGHGRL